MAILVSHAIQSVTKVVQLHHDCSHVQITHTGPERQQDSTSFIFAYIPPTTKQSELDRAYKISSKITNVIQTLAPHQPIFVMGDLNARIKKWQNAILSSDEDCVPTGELSETTTTDTIYLNAQRESFFRLRPQELQRSSAIVMCGGQRGLADKTIVQRSHRYLRLQQRL